MSCSCCLPHLQTLGAWPFCLVLFQRTSLHPMDCLCQNTHVHAMHLISSPSMTWTPPPMGLRVPSPSPCKEGMSDAHILNFLCHLVHNQGSLPTAQCTFALSSLGGSLSSLSCYYRPLQPLFHTLATHSTFQTFSIKFLFHLVIPSRSSFVQNLPHFPHLLSLLLL